MYKQCIQGVSDFSTCEINKIIYIYISRIYCIRCHKAARTLFDIMDLFSGSGELFITSTTTPTPNSTVNFTTNFSDGNPCAVFNTTKYSVLSGIRAFLSFSSFLCCVLVILLILLFKRYQYFVQRLVLYVCIAAAVNSIAIVLQKVDYSQQSEGLDTYCKFAGFFEFYTSLIELMSLLCITHGLYHSVVKQKPKKYLETFYIVISLAVPSIVACIPFFGITYGKSGPWCWIQERNMNCNPYIFGIALQFLLWYIPLVLVTLVIMCVSVATLYRVHKSIENRWQGPYDPEVFVHKGRLKKVVKVMLAYLPILYLIVNLVSLPNAIYWAIGDEPIFALWVLHGVFPPLRGALFALPYLFHTENRKQMNKTTIKAAFQRRFFKRNAVTEYPAKPGVFTDSLTFHSTGDGTIDRRRPYKNPSLKHNLDLSHTIHSPSPTTQEQEVVTVQLDNDSLIDSSMMNTCSQLTMTSQLTLISDNETENGQKSLS